MKNERYVKEFDEDAKKYFIRDKYKDILYDSLSDEFLKEINSDWESRQYHKRRREEAERLREIAVTAVEGLLALEKLRNEWYIEEFDKEY